MSKELTVGTVVAEKYRIEAVIGEGGMGAVYLAIEIGLERQVALKILKKGLARDVKERSRFLEEARTTAGLRHPYVIEVYEAGIWQEHPFIAMEYIKGQALDTMFAAALPFHLAIDILAKTAHALAAAHEQGLIHRDLKPENILVATSVSDVTGFLVKVVDWGLARATEAPKRFTKTGMVLGTPHYMAPEQIRGQKLSPAADLYALGVMLYCACAGHLPFDDPTTIGILQGHLSDEPFPLDELCPALPATLTKTAMALLAKDPTKRPQSAATIAAALDELVSSGALNALPPVVPSTAPARGKALPRARRGASRATGGAGRSRASAAGGSRAARDAGSSRRAGRSRSTASSLTKQSLAASVFDGTTTVPASRPQWLVPLMVSVIVLVCLAVGFQHLSNLFGSGQGSALEGSTASGTEACELREVTVKDIDRLALRVAGTVAKDATVIVRPAKGSAMIHEMTVQVGELSKRAISKTVSEIICPVPHPIVDTITVSLNTARPGSEPITAHPRLLEQVQVLRGLRGERLARFLDDFRRSISLTSDTTPQFCMAAVGLDASFASWVNQHYSLFVSKQTYLNDPIIELLNPLLALEVIPPSQHDFELPWKSLFNTLDYKSRNVSDISVTYGLRPLDETREGTVLGRISCHRTVFNADGQAQGVRRLWVHTPEQVADVHRSPDKYLTLINTASMNSKSAPAIVEDWQNSHEREFIIKLPAGTSWPPPAVTAIVDTIYLDHDRSVLIAFNDNRPYRLYRPRTPRQEGHDATTDFFYRLRFPVNPLELQAGKNKVVFRSEALTAKQPPPLYGTRLEGFALVAP